MQKLEERALLARWKSYKTFKHLGEIRLHTNSLFKEFHFDDDRILTIREYKNDQAETILKTNEWILEFSNKRHYLKVPQIRLVFEIITINHAVLVLMDNTSMDKIFFAKEECWGNYLQSNVLLTL